MRQDPSVVDHDEGRFFNAGKGTRECLGDLSGRNHMG